MLDDTETLAEEEPAEEELAAEELTEEELAEAEPAEDWHAIERRRELVRERRKYQTIAALTALTVLSLLLFLVSFVYENGRLTAEAGTRPGGGPGAAEAPSTIKPPVEALYTLFPANISGFATKAAHNTPYGQGLQAEAIYQPEDMEIQLAAPLTVYCLLTAWGSEEDARRDIERVAKDFPVDAGTTVMGAGADIVTTGLNTETGRYFVGHQRGSLSLVIYATDKRVVGGGGRDERLRSYGDKLAVELLRFLSEELSR